MNDLFEVYKLYINEIIFKSLNITEKAKFLFDSPHHTHTHNPDALRPSPEIIAIVSLECLFLDLFIFFYK